MSQPLSVVGAIFIRDGYLFAARRGNSRYAYTAHRYEFVGGKQESGERLEAALVRELREEMALEAEVIAPYMTLRHDYPDFSIVLHTFLCRMLGPYTLLEHESAAWLPIASLDPAEWAPADAPSSNESKRITILYETSHCFRPSRFRPLYPPSFGRCAVFRPRPFGHLG